MKNLVEYISEKLIIHSSRPHIDNANEDFEKCIESIWNIYNHHARNHTADIDSLIEAMSHFWDFDENLLEEIDKYIKKELDNEPEISAFRQIVNDALMDNKEFLYCRKEDTTDSLQKWIVGNMLANDAIKIRKVQNYIDSEFNLTIDLTLRASLEMWICLTDKYCVVMDWYNKEPTKEDFMGILIIKIE